ncbi:MAG: branched-chain amino acid aminotransferase [candidate division Zixibacteria bacterium]|nr:branched-chain amino acid aminotransferase [candidate division Zixibacteria bacterium]
MEFELRPIKAVPPAEIDFDSLGFAFIPTEKMFVARYAGGKWTDHGLIAVSEFWMHPAGGALHYGQAIFEGTKARLTRDGEIVLFRVEDNARRMADGCRRLMMPVYEEGKFVDAVTQTVLANKEYMPTADQGAMYIRPVMFASGPVLGVKPADEYLFLVFVSPVGPYFKEGFKPIKLKISKEYHRAAAGGVGCVKAAGNYAAGMYPNSLAKEDGYAEILYLDVDNKHFEEVGAANFFLRKGDELATPSLDDKTILPGYTRSSVLQLAADEGLSAVARDVMLEELYEADECLCTGTAAVITPIGLVEVDGKEVTVGDGGVGKYSQIFYDKLNAIMLKEAPDKYGWVMTIGKK